jgi:hypothetical protein
MSWIPPDCDDFLTLRIVTRHVKSMGSRMGAANFGPTRRTKMGQRFRIMQTLLPVAILLSLIGCAMQPSRTIESMTSKPSALAGPRPAPIVFQADFSSYEFGDPLPQWGENETISVLEAKDGRKCLGTQLPGLHTASHRLNFPENFSFEMEFIGQNCRGWDGPEGTSPTFIDSEGKEFKVLLHGNGPAFQLPDKAYVAPQPWNTEGIFRLEKKGTIYKIYWNNRFIESGNYPEYCSFVAYKFLVRPGDYITNIIVKDLGE